MFFNTKLSAVPKILLCCIESSILKLKLKDIQIITYFCNGTPYIRSNYRFFFFSRVILHHLTHYMILCNISVFFTVMSIIRLNDSKQIPLCNQITTTGVIFYIKVVIKYPCLILHQLPTWIPFTHFESILKTTQNNYSHVHITKYRIFWRSQKWSKIWDVLFKISKLAY